MDDLPPSELETAAIHGDVDLVKSLVFERHFDPKSQEAQNALCAASESGHWKIVHFLVQEAGVSVESADVGGLAVQYAAQAGELPLLEMLVNKGASLRSTAGSRALLSSAATGHLEVLRFLISHGANVKDAGGEAALSAAKASVWEAVWELITAGTDLKDGLAVQLQALAAVECQLEVVKWLEARGTNLRSEEATAALQSLSSTQHWDKCSKAVRYLVENGVNLRTDAGDAALITASVCGDSEMVKVLIEGGVSTTSSAASDALERAGELGSPESGREITDYLRAKGVAEPKLKTLVLDADF